MSLYEQWVELMDSQTEETFEDFWKEYSEAETKLYTHILKNKDTNLNGTFRELASNFGVRSTIFMGFLDGINSSLKVENDLDAITEDTALNLSIDFEKLFFNMLKADADYLYTLPQWEDVLSEERRMEITKEFKRSKTVHKEKEPGRNDPCPCGSGKKYKKCCGK
jgi:preprotein translocase subunit SecA